MRVTITLVAFFAAVGLAIPQPPAEDYTRGPGGRSVEDADAIRGPYCGGRGC